MSLTGLQLEPIEEIDIQATLTVSKASAKQYEQKYKLFHEEYGQVRRQWTFLGCYVL
jgi:hypothetical protein